MRAIDRKLTTVHIPMVFLRILQDEHMNWFFCDDSKDTNTDGTPYNTRAQATRAAIDEARKERRECHITLRGKPSREVAYQYPNVHIENKGKEN